jgi:riboflavin synthase
LFTGIIENLGEIIAIEKDQQNIHFSIKSTISKELKIDQSVAHNGVCLTVVKCDEHGHTVTAIDETLNKTNLGSWTIGSKINLERCMQMNGRIDGHIVQGHVDTTTECIAITDEAGSWRFRFKHPTAAGFLTVEKGSVCINGISLTVVDSAHSEFSVAIIPYTYEHTNMHTLKVGDKVNIEFDIIGKYLAKMMEART